MKIPISLAFLLLILTCLTPAAGPSVWSVNSRAEILKGDARGVSIDQDGTISLAPRLFEVYKSGQQFIWSSVVDGSGNVYLGTGGDGKIFKVTAGGAGSQFADLTELNVSALAIGTGGELYAGTSPDGKVYRIDASGNATVYFDPKQKYIWSLAVTSDGGLAVGTGDGGRIYKVRSANAAPESSILFDTSETNIISLAADRQGNLYAGTDPGGIVMRFGPDGKPFGLLDSPLREIHELAISPNGTVYALAIAASAPAAKPADGTPSATPVNPTVTVERPSAAPEPPAKSRYELKDAKSAVYRILPDGGEDLLWASNTIVGFSLYAHLTNNGVLVGTSDKGRIYSIDNSGRERLVLQSDADQISTIWTHNQSLFATSSNPGTMYRFGAERVAQGTYESSVLDAKATATWGRVWWRSSGGVAMQTRSGNTEKPDETWSGWSTELTDPKGCQISSPKARYIQWRAVLSGAASPTLSEVSLAFVGRNIAPEILSLTVLPTNVGLASNPPPQIDPNIQLTGLDPATFGIPAVTPPPRRVYQRGATSLQWTAEDRNGDKLVYDVYYREVSESTFKPLRESADENFISVDGQSLADGRYVFKIVARDTPSNPGSLALSGERLTDPIDIDNTAPVVSVSGSAQVTGNTALVVFEASDAASYLTRAEYSVNGGDWLSVYADDGISDGPRERYTLQVPLPIPGEYSVTLRVYDVNGNAGNARTVVRR
jgi:hypothetical protein